MQYLFNNRGLFITINDIGHVYELVCNFPEEHIKVCVVKVIRILILCFKRIYNKFYK